MQIKLQSNDYHVLVNTLGAELNSYSSPEGKEYIWNSDPTYCSALLRFFFLLWEMSETEKLLSKIIYIRCPSMVFARNLNLK